MVNKQDHKLIPLAKAFQEHWNIVIKKYKIRIDDKEDYFNHLFKLIGMIDKLDPNSMSFRYSNDKDNNKHFDGMQQIDIFNIKKLFDKVTLLLNYSIDLFDDQTGLMHGLDKNVLLNQR